MPATGSFAALRMTGLFWSFGTGSSKRFGAHCDMIALLHMHYNYCRVHMTTKTTPAVAAGIAERTWTLADVVKMIDTHFQRKLDAQFEAAFAAKYDQQSSTAKSYPPTPKG